MIDKKEITRLIDKAYKNRLMILKIIGRCGSVHLGGCFSAMDIITVLYDKVLIHDPKKPKWDGRDIFLLSAGHKAVSLYVVLQSHGYFEEDILWTFNKLHSKIPMHPDEKLLPGIEFPTGSLGHGLSVGCGIATAFKKYKLNRRVFVLLGDGESEEGTTWEAALTANKYKLDNLVAIIDANNLQSEAPIEEMLPIAPIGQKFQAFGWSVRTIDGHDISQIYKTLTEVPFDENKPNCIVANTIKAKGLDFAENKVEFHHWDPLDDSSLNCAVQHLKANWKNELKGKEID